MVTPDSNTTKNYSTTTPRQHSATMLPKHIRLLFVGNHPLSREGPRVLLAKLEEEGDVCVSLIEAVCCESAIHEMSSMTSTLDLVLLSCSSLVTTKQTIKAIRRNYVDLPIIALSNDDDPESLITLFESGARAVIQKGSSLATILSAIRLTLAGSAYLPESLLELLCRPCEKSAPAGIPANQHPPKRQPCLTPRQQRVLDLLLQGNSNKEISKELNLCQGTVKNHVSVLLRRLGVKTRKGAILQAGKRDFA